LFLFYVTLLRSYGDAALGVDGSRESRVRLNTA
jgi:hypothetical protein